MNSPGLPLAGLRVIELGDSALTGLCAMMLADFGAEVVWLDPGEGGGSYQVWQRGKQRLKVDLEAESTQIRELIVASADVFLVAGTRVELQELGLDYATLGTLRPNLIMAQLSGFGNDNPYSTLPAMEGLAAAKFGRMMSFEGVASRAGPVFPALQVATHATAQAACAGVLAAIAAGVASNQGRYLETNLLRGLLPFEMHFLLANQRRESDVGRPRPDPHKFMPSINYQPVQTRDGQWLQLGNLLPHLLRNFLDVAGLQEISDDPDFGQLPWSETVVERFRRLLFERMQSEDLDTWMDRFVSHGGVVAHPYQSAQVAMSDADIVANGHVVTVDDVDQLGLVARLTRTPGQVGGKPKNVRWAELRENQLPAGRRGGTVAATLPLTGVTVLECATIIAAPMAAGMLADMGARVIKVEPLNGDPFRHMGAGFGAARVNTGKESICLDLKQAQARDILARLAASADILIHNYRPGVPERLGLDYPTLAAGNRQLVYLSANGYGPSGPGAKRPSTHPIPGAALGGVLYQFGGSLSPARLKLDELRDYTRRLFRANEVNPDPNTSMVVATGAMLGLVAARRCGVGQEIFVDMFGANAYANFDDFLRYDGKRPRRELDSELFGVRCWQRLYRCSEGWVFLGISSDRDWQRFVTAVAPELVAAFPDLAACGDAETSLASQLETLFLTHTAIEWESKLLAVDVGCLRADAGTPGELLLDEPFFHEQGLVTEADHPLWGRYLRHGSLLAWNDVPDHLPGAGTAGDSTDALLGSIGYSTREVADMKERGVAA